MAEVNFLVKKGLTVPKGSAATPAVIFDASDPNTGIYSPGADQLALSTNGTGRLFVDASGNVGLGGASGGNRLSVDGIASNSPALFSSNTTETFIALESSSSTNNFSSRIGTTSDALTFRTLNAERLRITSAGLVGIGTSSPGSVLDLGVGTTGRALSWHNTSTVSYGHIWNSYGSGAVVLAHALKGSTSVSDGFESSISTSRARSALELKNGTINLYTDPASTVAYGTSFTPTPRLSIDSSGRVGIGTTSPSASSLLDVTSTTQGFLPPRMTGTQRDAISSPAAGLMVYNTTTNKLNFYNGTAWEAVTSL